MAIMSSSRTAVPSRQHLTSVMYALPGRRLKEILSLVFPHKTLGPVEELQTTQLARLYFLTMSDDQKLILSLAPSLSVQLLRHEAAVLSSEAKLAYFLRNSDQWTEPQKTNLREHVPDPDHAALSALVPRLIKHSSNIREVAYPYSIFEATTGVPLSTIATNLGVPDLRFIDKQIGLLARALASFTSPSGGFGPADKVLPEPFTALAPTPETTGSKLWSEAFHTLLEGVLRDGEDKAVLLPYEIIRAHYKRLSYHLDSVLLPRLVVLNVGSDSNVMVERSLHEMNSERSPVERGTLAGLRSWSQGVFGDPLLADCFDGPSESFLEGWGAGGDNIVEDEANAPARMLLYRCFRAVVSIVTEYYRPQGDSSRKELEGRRKLTSALAEIEKLGATGADTLKRTQNFDNDDDSFKKQRAEA